MSTHGDEDEEHNVELDEIVALDAVTLQLRYRFGQSLLNDVQEMVVVGEELFVCDCGNNRLQVFSLAGEHRRSITGEWQMPFKLCAAKDRLYLLEAGDWRNNRPNNLPVSVLVLSLQGNTIQVYTHPEGHSFADICAFDGKLLSTVGPHLGHEAPFPAHL